MCDMDGSGEARAVGEVAELTGVTGRSLRWYDVARTR